MQLEDLLAVRPSDGPPAPVAPGDGVRSPLVAAQQLPELLGVWQEDGGGARDAEEQDGDQEPGHGSRAHSGTSAVWVRRTDGQTDSRRRLFKGSRSNLQGGNMSLDVPACESSDYKMWVRMDLPTGSSGENPKESTRAAASFLPGAFNHSELQ